MIKKVYFHGFSLIEVSISLIIIGIISAIGMSQLNIMNRIYRTQKTQSNIDFVVKSIAAFYLASDCNNIPFPSDMKINIGYQSKNMENSFGIVPFKTLGIMEKFAKNAKGKWLLYRINPNFGKNISFNKNLGVSEFSSEIPGDKVAFIIKSQNEKNQDEITIWYSEKTFISNFANNKTSTLINSDVLENLKF